MEVSESGGYMELMMTNAMLDCQMQCIKSKIKSKNEENTKLENHIIELRKKISHLEKSIQTSLERESKIKNNIYSLQNSRCITEGLVMSMKHELRISQGKRAETKSTRNKIILKYSDIFQSYRDVYKNLPWIQKNYELKITTEIRRIKLNILKSEYSSYKNKLTLFNKIGEQRMIVAIVNLAKLMVERNNYEKDLMNIANNIVSSEANIIKLKEEKLKILEKIDLKVKAAVAEARERAAKAQTSVYAEGPKQWVPSVVFPTTTSNQSRESIFSRLGLGGPLTLKRALPFKPSIPEKISRVLDTPRLEDIFKPEQKDKGIVKKKDVPAARIMPETPTSSGTDQLLPSKRTEELSSLKNKQEKERPKTTGKISLENVIHSKENESNLKAKTLVQKKLDKTVPTALQNVQPVQKSPPKMISSDNDSVEEELEKKRKKLKKKSKKVSSEKCIAENLAPDVEKKDTFFTEEIKKDQKQDTRGQEKVVETKVVSPEKPKEDSAMISECPINNEIVQELQGNYNESTTEQTILPADISIDTDSVLSANFNIENRDDISERNLESPDFFIARPQGYCFSPPYGQTSSPVADKSEKGNKKAIYDFGESPAMSPLFPMDNQKKASAGPSASFADFFGSSSPQKPSQSTKSFFQLFG